MSELSGGWEARVSKSRCPGQVYYHNTITGECTWLLPESARGDAVPAARRPSSAMAYSKRMRQGRNTVESVSQAPLLDTVPEGDGMEIDGVCPWCTRPINPAYSDGNLQDLINMLTPPKNALQKSLAETLSEAPTYCVCEVRNRMLLLLKALATDGADTAVIAPPDSSMSLSDRLERMSDAGISPSPRRLRADYSPGPGLLKKRQGSTLSLCSMASDSELIGISESPLSLTDFDVFSSADDTLPQSHDPERVKAFDLDNHTRAAIPLQSYLDRLWRHSRVSESTFVVALVYIVRLVRADRLELTTRNIYKILLSAVVAAAKNCEDAQLSNRSFAVVGGVSVKELNRLEVDFLYLLRWRMDVTPEEWVAACQALVSSHENADPNSTPDDLWKDFPKAT